MKVARGLFVGSIVAAAAGLAAVMWAVAVPRPGLYVAGVLACASALLVRLAVHRTRRELVVLSVIVAVLVAAAIAVPKAVLAAQLRPEIRWSAELADRAPGDRLLRTWVIGDRIYVASSSLPMRSYDRGTGRLVATYPAATADHVAVTADGSVVGWTAGEAQKRQVTLYAPDGKVRWTRQFHGRSTIDRLPQRTPVVAAADGVVVLADCRDGRQESYGNCTWTGVDQTGETSWTRTTDWQPSAENEQSMMFGRTLSALPSIILGKGEENYVVLAAADGRELLLHKRLVGTRTAVQGDIAVFAEFSGDGCRIVGYRDGEQAFSTDGVRCLVLGRLTIVGERAYMDGEAGRGQLTVGMTDGAAQALEGVGLSGWPGSTPAPGPDVIVYRDGKTLTARDAGSGQELWKQDAPGKVIGVLVDNGGVLVRSEVSSHNPFFPRKDQYSWLTTWDARTGERIAGRLARGGDMSRQSSIGPGQALVQSEDGRTVSLLG
ncbi:PQQ-binding-like beta-propeller repeat protein [Kribbella sp. NPDC051936]|uniref:outer membrane protein assembly factor BamB family protein n=1 Tax=Kribbella sp. NPDC051936 TaxID=3154946 RepID=UPI00344330F1